MKKSAATAAALVATTVLSGAAVMPGSATEDRAMHTKRLVLHEIASHEVGRYAFAGADTARSRSTHEVVGYDSYTGKFYPATNKVVIDVAFALKGGVIVGRVSLSETEERFHGRILKGTGRYNGIEGTITGREGRNVYLTMHYRL